jgi:multidrug efflux system membrane fusion protein
LIAQGKQPNNSSIDTVERTSTSGRAPAPVPGPKRGWVLRALIWIVLLLIFGFAFYFVLSHKEDAKAKPAGRRGVSGPINLTTATAQKGDIGVYIDAIGIVTPVHTA